MEQKENFFKKKKTTVGFALAALVAGFLFIGSGNITGDVVLNNQQPISLLPIIGLALILCAVVLAVYSIKE